MQLINTQERAVIRKDFHDVWDLKMARDTLLIVPLILVVAIPVIFLTATVRVPLEHVNGIAGIMKLLPAEAKSLDVRQASLYLMTNVLFPMLFLMIPLMVSSVSAASSFVGEKERGTLETLLLTPMSLKQIFKAKVFGCVLLSASVTAVSFAAFAVVVTVGDILLRMPFFFSWSWLVLILLVAPSVTVFGVVFIVLISSKSRSYVEAVQTSGYIVMPLILLFLGEISGLFMLNALNLLLLSLVVILADCVLLHVTARSFQSEKLLK